MKSESRFGDVKAANGEYLQTWFEYLPEEVVKGTAPAGTVPLWLALHGGGDDRASSSMKSACSLWPVPSGSPWWRPTTRTSQAFCPTLYPSS